jgi:pyruvate dehydrogenase E1 component beta subunit
MSQRPGMVYTQQQSIGSATRPDGKSINMLDMFGLDRCLGRFGLAIDEDWQANSAIGYAATGQVAITQTPSMTPMFTYSFMEEQAGMLQTQLGGQLKCPMILIQQGAGRTSVTQHANVSADAKYPNSPGLVTMNPHLVYDVKGLMHSAIRLGGPVVYIFYSSQASADIPDEPFVVPIGKGQILKEGTDVTIYCHPPASVEVEKALPLLEKEGIKAEYFDPRTLKPFDEDLLKTSVTKTKRLFCVDFGYYTHCFSRNVMAAASMLVPGTKMWLIAYPDVPPPFSREMNRWMIPDAAKIVDAVKKFLKT